MVGNMIIHFHNTQVDTWAIILLISSTKRKLIVHIKYIRFLEDTMKIWNRVLAVQAMLKYVLIKIL